MSFAEHFPRELAAIEDGLRARLGGPPVPALAPLWESLAYSLFSGGKRFRPLLSVLTAAALGRPPGDVMPLAMAVELIHTYSLVHDDLPCMDDDDLRRGRATSHKVYGEAGALLAGDALLTLAFETLAGSDSPAIGPVCAKLARAAGASGMVGGQAMDVAAEGPDAETIGEIHRRKTGALIAVSVEGAAILSGARAGEVAALASYGENLGFAFQLADDLEDHDPGLPEKVSFTARLGEGATRAELARASDRARSAISGLTNADGLRRMIDLNGRRA